jgi:hypothetical protein
MREAPIHPRLDLFRVHKDTRISVERSYVVQIKCGDISLCVLKKPGLSE